MNAWLRRPYLILGGSLIGVIYAFIGILLVYRTGMSISSSLVTPLLVFLLARIFFRPSSADITLAQSISSGASLATFSLESAFAAAILFGPSLPLPLWIPIGLGIGANSLGILMTIPMIGIWIEGGKLPFPKAQAIGQVILSLTKEKISETWCLIWSAVGAAFTTLVVTLNRQFVNPIATWWRLPSFVGVEISPLLFGLGMFLPFKAVALLMVGATYSLGVWILKANAADLSFSEHLFQPLIFSVAIGLALGHTVLNLPDLFVQLKKGVVNNSVLQGAPNRYWLIGVGGLILTLSVFLRNSVLQFPYYGIPPLLIIAVLFALITARTRGETGLGTTATVYFSIPLIALFTKNITTILLLAGTVTLFTITFSDCLEVCRLGKVTSTPITPLLLCYALGSIFGVVAGSISMAGLNHAYEIGTSTLPVPTSLAWGTVAQAVVGQGLPQSINLWLVSGGLILSIILSHYKCSPLLIGMGILVPVSVVIAISLGGLTRHILINRKIPISSQTIGAGLVAGEGLVAMVSVLVTLFRFR